MTTDEKLDYLIGKVEQLENEIKKIRVENEKGAYFLEAKFQDIFRDLRDNISHMDSANYKYYSELNHTIREVDSKNSSLERRVGKVEGNSPMNQLTEKIVSWSPMIMFLFIIWIFFIFIILQ